MGKPLPRSQLAALRNRHAFLMTTVGILRFETWLPITVLLCYFSCSFTGANPVIDSKTQCHITHYSTTAINVASAHPYLQ
jgi:hypothetical protein